MLVFRYNQIDSGEDAQEEFGWKLVHGDVFRLMSMLLPLKASTEDWHSNVQF